MNLTAIDFYRYSPSSQPRPQPVQSDCASLQLVVALFFFTAAVLPALGDRIAYKAVLAHASESTFWAAAGDTVPFNTVARGYRSGVTNGLKIAVSNQTDWTSLWKNHTAVEETRPVPPIIDFKNEIVAAVLLGTRTTGGFDIEIAGAGLSGNKLTKTYREKRPGPGDMTTRTVNQPFHMVRFAAMGVKTTDSRRLS